MVENSAKKMKDVEKKVQNSIKYIEKTNTGDLIVEIGNVVVAMLHVIVEKLHVIEKLRAIEKPSATG